MVQGLIAFNNQDYVPQQWHGTLLMWAFIVLPVISNVCGSLLHLLNGADCYASFTQDDCLSPLSSQEVYCISCSSLLPSSLWASLLPVAVMISSGTPPLVASVAGTAPVSLFALVFFPQHLLLPVCIHSSSALRYLRICLGFDGVLHMSMFSASLITEM